MHNQTQYNVILSVAVLFLCAGNRFTELCVVMLHFKKQARVLLSVIMLSVVILTVTLQNEVTPSSVWPSVIMVVVIMLIVVALEKEYGRHLSV